MKIAGVNFSKKAYEEIKEEFECVCEDYTDEELEDPIMAFDTAVEIYLFNRGYHGDKQMKILEHINKIYDWFKAMEDNN